MNFTLKRNNCSPFGVFGELITDAGEHFCFTLEHANPPDSRPIIPHNKYLCVRGHMVKKNLDTFEVTNVPGHTGIFIHPGNYNHDSEGCILLGMSVGENCIENSREAFAKFMSAMEGVNQFYLTILDPEVKLAA